jgi:hypothetical protein
MTGEPFGDCRMVNALSNKSDCACWCPGVRKALGVADSYLPTPVGAVAFLFALCERSEL